MADEGDDEEQDDEDSKFVRVARRIYLTAVALLLAAGVAAAVYTLFAAGGPAHHHDPNAVNVIAPDGTAANVDANQLAEAKARGCREATGAEVQVQEAKEAQERIERVSQDRVTGLYISGSLFGAAALLAICWTWVRWVSKA